MYSSVEVVFKCNESGRDIRLSEPYKIVVNIKPRQNFSNYFFFIIAAKYEDRVMYGSGNNINWKLETLPV